MLDFCAKTMDAYGLITLKEKIGVIILRPILVAINVKRKDIMLAIQMIIAKEWIKFMLNILNYKKQQKHLENSGKKKN